MDDQARFLGCFLKCQDDIRAFLGSIVRDRHACDDLLQEVALTLWKKFDEYDPTRPFGAWARGIAAKKVLQSFEKSKKLPILLSQETIEAILEAYNQTEPESGSMHSALEACLKLLPERSQNLISMRYEKTLKLGEIAQAMESTLDAVHKALSRIRGALRKCIEEQLAAG
jgi:RNA polymerase sigma-70 factor (ECF subfamily)